MEPVTVILPASNEESLIGDCLDAVLASSWSRIDSLQVVVVANGCTDRTAEVARTRTSDFGGRGWSLEVIELAQGSKIAALNAGDAAARGATRIYLDADVVVSAPLLEQIAGVLDVSEPRYASGLVEMTAQGWISRAYAGIWRQVPFMAECVPGCGVFAVNAPGRKRWDEFPKIISDDTFVRLNFTPVERIGVAAGYTWPIAEGFRNLVKVRRRQDVGVDEIGRAFPDLLKNDDKVPMSKRKTLGMALRSPVGFAVYTGVALISKLTRHRAKGWSRGR